MDIILLKKMIDCLIGYFYVEYNDNNLVLGLGVRPNDTGKGISFLRIILHFIKTNFKYQKITLSVKCFNTRAIKVYKKVDFIEIEVFKQYLNGNIYDFLLMEYVGGYENES